MSTETVNAESLYCIDCKHLQDGETYTCPAFPYGIPTAIIYGIQNHTEVLSHQIGSIVYEKI